MPQFLKPRVIQEECRGRPLAATQYHTAQEFLKDLFLKKQATRVPALYELSEGAAAALTRHEVSPRRCAGSDGAKG